MKRLIDFEKVGHSFKCSRCNEAINVSRLEETKNIEIMTLLELHRVGHLLEDLLTQGIHIERTPPIEGD